LWTIPRPSGAADLIVNRQTGQWGTGYNRTFDLGVATMKIDRLDAAVEEFTMSIVPSGAGRGVLRMAWGKFEWTAPIVLANQSRRLDSARSGAASAALSSRSYSSRMTP
jgi:hypothetical protein